MKKSFIGLNKTGPRETELVEALSPNCAKSHCACDSNCSEPRIIKQGYSGEEVEKFVKDAVEAARREDAQKRQKGQEPPTPASKPKTRRKKRFIE